MPVNYQWPEPFAACLGEPVRSNNSCGAAIVLQQTSEPVATLNGAAALFGFIASAIHG